MTLEYEPKHAEVARANLARAGVDDRVEVIVGAALAAVAYVLVRQGKERGAAVGNPLPEQTIETVKEDVEWAKTRATSARK